MLDIQRKCRILEVVPNANRGNRLHKIGVGSMFKNVLEAIRDGEWHYEPDEVDPKLYPATTAIPGTEEKLEVLAARVRAGLPLWHKSDRPDYDDPRAG